MDPLYLGKMGTFVNFRYINNLALHPHYLRIGAKLISDDIDLNFSFIHS